MSTVTFSNTPNRSQPDTPPLEAGDRLSRAEFERRYDAMPGLNKAELIEGEVHMPSPVGWTRHAMPHQHLSWWLGSYQMSTPGVQVGDNASIRLDLDNMPQPDAAMIIDPRLGGQTQTSADDYVVGGPELVAEVSSSTVSIDLHAKFQVYRRNGVQEYLVWRVRDQAIDWFVLRDGEFERLPAEPDGTLRSRVFPGLWLSPAALLAGDLATVLKVLQQGLAHESHSEFVRRLQSPR
ncbi:MAG: Uma2 family endonuclease [Planctomycetales bacterium]|nr:Uma2 family endonuclease [Planctomycetales bacterium]